VEPLYPDGRQSRRSPGIDLLGAAAVVVIIAGLRAARPLVVPLVVAAFIAVPCMPAMGRLRRMGVPAGLAVTIVVLGLAGLLVGVGWFLGASLSDLALALPAYADEFEAQLAQLVAWLERFGLDVPDRRGLIDLADPASTFGFFATVVGEVGALLTESVLLLLTVAFMLLEAAGFRAKLTRAFGEERAERVAPAFAAFAAGVKQYLYLKTLIGLLTGVLVAVMLAVLGVDFPILWGFVTFLFGYIPNIGSIVAAVPGTLLALVQHGPIVGLVVAAGYLVIDMGTGKVLEPRWMGRGVGLSPLVVLLSLVFWAFVMGPMGLLLAVPLTMTLKIALEATNEGRWLAVLLGPDEAPAAPELARGAPALPDAAAAIAPAEEPAE
jgi:predicted PurR-regulated permease PerM